MISNLARVLLLGLVCIGQSSFSASNNTAKLNSQLDKENRNPRHSDSILQFRFNTAENRFKVFAKDIAETDCLTAYSEFSPNGDGEHDIFFISCVEKYPNNYLQVFNRWGTKVFDMKGYNNTWDGSSTGIRTMGAKRKLPIGTYYYVLDTGDDSTKQKKGWLYLSK